MNHYFQKGRIIIILQHVCRRIRTFGALPHTTLACRRMSGGHPLCDDRSGTERHHRPPGHANRKWMGQDSNLRCFFVTDLQSAALAAGHTHPWGDQGESVSAPLRSAQSRCPPDILRPHKQSHNLPDYHCPIATVAPAGLEPIISGLRGRRPDL